MTLSVWFAELFDEGVHCLGLQDISALEEISAHTTPNACWSKEWLPDEKASRKLARKSLTL